MEETKGPEDWKGGDDISLDNGAMEEIMAEEGPEDWKDEEYIPLENEKEKEPMVEAPDGYSRPAARQTVEPGKRLSQLGLLRLGLKPKNAPRDETFWLLTMLWQVSLGWTL